MQGFGYRTGTKPLMRYNWFLIIMGEPVLCETYNVCLYLLLY